MNYGETVDRVRAACVREAIEKHRDEVAELVCCAYPLSFNGLTAEATLDCLLALVEGREWPAGGEKP